MKNDNNVNNRYDAANEDYSINEVIINRSMQLGLKQIDLINQTGIKTSKMSKIFNKKLKPSFDDLEKLSTPLKLSKETLWIVCNYMLPTEKESQVQKEIIELKQVIKELNKKDTNITQYLQTNIKLAAKEIEFIEEYLEFVKYKRAKK